MDENTFNQATSAIEWESLPYEEYWDYYIKKYGNKITEENLKEIETVRVFSRNRCPIGCKFCSSTNQITWGSDEKVPVISATHETLIHNIKRIIESHPRVKTIYLTDDDFCINKKDVIRFCKKIVEEKFKNLTFMSFCRASDATDEMFYWLKKANWRRLNIGIESFSDKVLKDMRKRCTKEQNHEALRLAKKNGIPAFLNIIVTTPESTLDDVKKTVNGAMIYAKDSFFHVGITLAIKPLKGTDYFEEYTNFMSRIVEIPNTQYKVKVDDLIFAKDPKVKMLQLRYWDEIDDYIQSQQEKRSIKHQVASNLSLIKLELLSKLIDEIENQFKTKKMVNSKSYKSKSMPKNERQTVDIEDDFGKIKKKLSKSTHGTF